MKRAYRHLTRGRLVLLLILSLVLSACTPSTAPAAKDELLRIGAYSVIIGSMDPFTTGGRGRGVVENIYEPLVFPYRDTTEIRGVLAESWTVSPGGTTYRFNLRKGVTFHDGTPFDAESVKLTLQQLRKVGTNEFIPLLADVKETRVIDPNTIEFVLDDTQPCCFLARLTGLLIASPKAIAEHGDDRVWWIDKDSGTGPYKVKEILPKDRLVMERNDKWWGPTPYFPTVIWFEVPEQSAQALMIERGDLDMAFAVPPASQSLFAANPKLRLLSVPGPNHMMLQMNVRRPPLNNKTLRQAVAYAFDYRALETALEPVAAPGEGPVPSRYLGGWVPPGLIREQNLDKAKALLAEAGYKPGELRITLSLANIDQQKYPIIGSIFKSSLAKIGVEVDFQLIDFGVGFQRLQRFKADPVANAKEADGLDVFGLLRNPYLPHAIAYFNTFLPGISWNEYGYSNPAAARLIEQGNRATNPADTINYYKQAIELIVADQPHIDLYNEKQVVVMRDDIEGYYMHPTQFPETHVWTIKRKKG